MDEMRGVIDRFEGALAVIVLDDEQRLLWPRAALPTSAESGTAVRLCLVPVPPSGDLGEIRPAEGTPPAGSAAELPARVLYDAASDQWQLTLANGSVLHWTAESAPLEANQLALLRLVVDLEDTAARRKRVQNLLDDLFSSSGT